VPAIPPIGRLRRRRARSNELKVLGGDFPASTELILHGQFAELRVPGDGDSGLRVIRLTRDSVSDLVVVSEEAILRFGRAVSAGAVTGLFLGVVVGVGVLMGAVAGNRRHETTFILTLTDGERMLAVTDSKTFLRLKFLARPETSQGSTES
jgi:hypothetical protein